VLKVFDRWPDTITSDGDTGAGKAKMTTTEAIANYRAARFSILAESLRVAANDRDGFQYAPATLARAATAPAGIVGR
jgi:hypothetical protein